MNRFRVSVGALLIAGSLAVSGQETGAQPVSQEQIDAERIAKQQYTIDGIRAQMRHEDGIARAAQVRGACEEFYRYTDALSQYLGSYMLYESLVPPQTFQQLRRERDQLVAELKRLPCPPQQTTARNVLQSAVSVKVQVQMAAEAVMSVLRGIKVENGGLGGEQSVTAPGAELGVKSPRFETRGFIGGGQDKTALSGSGTTTTQPNGGQQQIQGAGPVSGGERKAEIFRAGGEAQFNFPDVPRGWLPFVPFIGFGFEHFRLENRLFAQWAPISFTVEDVRKVETNRGYIFAGARHDVANVSGVDLFVRWLFQMNVDSVDGFGIYRTMQVNNFDEMVSGSANKTAFTVGGQITAGAATTLANGMKLEFNTFVGAVPVWELEYRNGQPATLSDDHKLNFGAQAAVRIPFNFDPIAGRR